MASWELLRMAKLGALVTVSVTLSLTGLGDSVLVKLAVLVMTVPSGSGMLTVTAKATVTGWLGVTVKSLARIGGTVPAVPALEGVRRMLSVIKVVFAGRVSDRTAPVALAVPLLLTTIV